MSIVPVLAAITANAVRRNREEDERRRAEAAKRDEKCSDCEQRDGKHWFHCQKEAK